MVPWTTSQYSRAPRDASIFFSFDHAPADAAVTGINTQNASFYIVFSHSNGEFLGFCLGELD